MNMSKTSAEKDLVVMRSAPEAATFRTDIYGWVSRGGIFYGDNEDIARYAGCTHVECNRCGKPVEKRWLACDGCRDLADIEQFEKRDRKDWDGIAMLYSQRTDEYYSDFDAILDAMSDDDETITLADMRLMVCEPCMPLPLNSDFFEDCFAEDHDESDLPKEIWDAMDAFNAVLGAMTPLSWSPGKFALDLNGPVVKAIIGATPTPLAQDAGSLVDGDRG
jgi:hypothetical protein